MDVILAPDDVDPVTVVGAARPAPLVFVCEHASPTIPAALGDLGLSAGDRFSHAVWDPGALELAKALAARFDAPLVAGTLSRLVYDLNRARGEPSAMPDRVERVAVPGNAGLSAGAREARFAAVYAPFCAKLSAVIAAVRPVALITIHTFTPVWHGGPRAVELGVIHDREPALARAMVDHAPEGLATGLNQPYSAADGVAHTLKVHGTENGIAAAMIEVRNDLVATREAAHAMAARLFPMVERALSVTGLLEAKCSAT
ncbi:MAG: N-formylglutamate amidohydrolase [Pseudomonadota bacterium]